MPFLFLHLALLFLLFLYPTISFYLKQRSGLEGTSHRTTGAALVGLCSFRCRLDGMIQEGQFE